MSRHSSEAVEKIIKLIYPTMNTFIGNIKPGLLCHTKSYVALVLMKKFGYMIGIYYQYVLNRSVFLSLK